MQGLSTDFLAGVDVLPSAAAPPWLRLVLVGAALVVLLVIGIVDARHRIIPDAANATLAGLGLVAAGAGGLDALLVALVQGAASFTLFWLVRTLYRVARGVQGLGFGDVKFMGAAGLWVGLGGVAPLVLVACVAALAFVIVAKVGGATITGRYALPFGPFLALGLAVLLTVGAWWPENG